MRILHMIALTDEEVELLYDALDAANDRYEQYKDDYEEDLEHVTSNTERNEVKRGLEKARQDIALTASLNRDFQPLIKAIRKGKTEKRREK